MSESGRKRNGGFEERGYGKLPFVVHRADLDFHSFRLGRLAAKADLRLTQWLAIFVLRAVRLRNSKAP
jgi:hypothetical protein